MERCPLPDISCGRVSLIHPPRPDVHLLKVQCRVTHHNLRSNRLPADDFLFSDRLEVLPPIHLSVSCRCLPHRIVASRRHIPTNKKRLFPPRNDNENEQETTMKISFCLIGNTRLWLLIHLNVPPSATPSHSYHFFYCSSTPVTVEDDSKSRSLF